MYTYNTLKKLLKKGKYMVLIYGRSGTGKSTYLYNEIKKRLYTDSKIYIITPEQFSFVAEKKLLDISNGSVTNAEVLSFERISYKVSNEVEGILDVNLDLSGRQMILYDILNKTKLNFLNNSNENIDLISRQITEFKKHNIKIPMIEKTMEISDDKYLNLKLNDLKILYAEYENKIKERFIDENDVLSLLSERIEKSEMFYDSYIYIDEFAGFTAQEYIIIEKLLKMAKSVTITICTDNIEKQNASGIFYSNIKTIKKLREIAKRINNDIETIKLLETYRFRNEELKWLEKNIYESVYKVYTKKVENIRLTLNENAYSEVEEVAKRILNLVQIQNYRFKDIAIITKNIGEYGSLIKSIFNQYEIPVFIDEKKNLTSNIFIKYISSLLDIFSNNWSYESMFNYIKSGFIGLEKEDIFEVEKYCIKYGIRGNKWYKEDWKINIGEDLEKLNAIRKKIVEPLIELKSNLQGIKHAKNISEEIYKFLIKNKIDKTLDEKITKLEEKGDLNTADELSQTMKIVTNIFDEIVLVFSEERMTIEKYIDLFKIGLKNNELGRIPMRLDEVIVGDVDRSRTSKVRAIFIIGLNDGNFPAVNKQEGFINDKERELLKRKGIELANTTEEQIYEEQFNIYKAFSQAEEKMFLSYVSSDKEGKAIRPSILISKMKKIFVELVENSNFIENMVVLGNEKTTFEELIINLKKSEDGIKINENWFEVLEWYKKNEKWNKKLKIMEYFNNAEKIDAEKINILYGDTLKTSISKLEQYKKCPFSYYLKYALNVKEENTFKIQPIDTGTFMHDIIQNFFDKLKEEKIDVKNINDDEIAEITKEIILKKLQLEKNYIFSSSAKFANLTKKLIKVIEESIKHIINQQKCSEFIILENEARFKEGYKYPSISIELQDGKIIEITGKIDRIDALVNEGKRYVQIIDYKSSKKDIDLNELKAGVQIQLFTYLDSITKIENAIPAGVLYFSLIESIADIDKKADEEKIKQEIEKKFKMSGIILSDIKVIKMMDKNLEHSKSSNYIPVYLDGKGDIYKKWSKVVSDEEFKKLQQYTKKIIKQISKEILNGNIDIKPSYSLRRKESNCKYCEYKAICRFDSNLNEYTYIEKQKNEEILKMIKEEFN